MKIAWSIAASDSSSGAGIQADLAVFAKFKVHGCSVISKITAQNTEGVSHSYTLPAAIFQQQLLALANDLTADAIKISVIGSIEQLNLLCEFLEHYSGAVIYDPVFSASTQFTLTDINLLDAICANLLPKVTLLTPNLAEAELLSKLAIHNKQDMVQAGGALLDFGARNILIKGGHTPEEQDFQIWSETVRSETVRSSRTDWSGLQLASDLFINRQESFWLVSQRQVLAQKKNIHGTGCHLSSAICANLALGHTLIDALIIGKRYINSAIAACYQPTQESGQYYLSQFKLPFKSADLPLIVMDYKQIQNTCAALPFLSCGSLGLYPVLPSSAWVERIIACISAGVVPVLAPQLADIPLTMQLRIKDNAAVNLEQEIQTSIRIAKHAGIKLFINDHWELAIKYQAYGVHLGQEDLATADLTAIKQSGLRLGISSHIHYELAVEASYKPSYIALGPIYPTTSKIMPWEAQGLERIREWQDMLDCPLVVIGGIGLDNIDAVIAAGAKHIALISALTQADNPQQCIRELLYKVMDNA